MLDVILDQDEEIDGVWGGDFLEGLEVGVIHHFKDLGEIALGEDVGVGGGGDGGPDEMADPLQDVGGFGVELLVVSLHKYFIIRV